MTKKTLLELYGWTLNIVIVPPEGKIPTHKHRHKREWYLGLLGSGALTMGEKQAIMKLGSWFKIVEKTTHGLTTDKGFVFLTLESIAPKGDVVFIK